MSATEEDVLKGWYKELDDADSNPVQLGEDGELNEDELDDPDEYDDDDLDGDAPPEDPEEPETTEDPDADSDESLDDKETEEEEDDTEDAPDADPEQEPESEETPEPDNSNSDEPSTEQSTVPIAKHSRVNRELRKTNRALKERDEQITALQNDMAVMKRKALVAGVELDGNVSIEMNDETYLELHDKYDEPTANLFMQQHNQIVELQESLKTLQGGTEQQGYSDEEVSSAIAANDTLSVWLEAAKGGNSEAFDIATRIDSELEGEFSDIDARYDKVVELATAEIKEKVKTDPETTTPPKRKTGKSGKAPERSLSSQSGRDQSANDLDRIMELSGPEQMAAIEKLPRHQRDKIEAKLFSN